MAPGWIRPIETVEVGFRDGTIGEEVVVLLSTRYRDENVERGNVRLEIAKDVHVFLNAMPCVRREADDVREMADDSIPSAQLHDVAVRRRMILSLVRRQQCLPAE